jgi:hypothetical protein
MRFGFALWNFVLWIATSINETLAIVAKPFPFPGMA